MIRFLLLFLLSAEDRALIRTLLIEEEKHQLNKIVFYSDPLTGRLRAVERSLERYYVKAAKQASRLAEFFDA